LPCLIQAQVVPRFQDNSIPITDLVGLAENEQLIIFHPSKKQSLPIGDGKKQEFNVRFVTTISVIEAPVQRVREVVTDFVNYDEFMPQTESSIIISKTKDHVVHEAKLSVKVPLIHIAFRFTLDYFMAPNGDITWSRVKGDIKGNVGRYEFIALTPNRTMLIMTYWAELQGIGFLMRLLLRIQPDLELAIPISSGALIVDAIKKRSEMTSKTKHPNLENLPLHPDIPLMTHSNLPIDTLQLLSRIGTLIFVHQPQWIKSADNKPVIVSFITSAARMQGPIRAVKPLVTNFSRYPEFMYQIKYAKQTMTYDGMLVDWRLKFGLAFLSFYVDFVLDYKWKNNNILTYHCKSGDIEKSYGCWEWVALSDNQTMTFFTTAIPMDARVPFILKFTKMIPNSQVVMGASSTVVTIERITPWVEDQVLEAINLYQ
jgi:ribosome-associated toxin RatA of RatAB toxin-antitoxin module